LVYCNDMESCSAAQEGHQQFGAEMTAHDTALQAFFTEGDALSAGPTEHAAAIGAQTAEVRGAAAGMRELWAGRGHVFGQESEVLGLKDSLAGLQEWMAQQQEQRAHAMSGFAGTGAMADLAVMADTDTLAAALARIAHLEQTIAAHEAKTEVLRKLTAREVAAMGPEAVAAYNARVAAAAEAERARQREAEQAACEARRAKEAKVAAREQRRLLREEEARQRKKEATAQAAAERVLQVCACVSWVVFYYLCLLLGCDWARRMHWPRRSVKWTHAKQKRRARR
jgi:hypothetical protein